MSVQRQALAIVVFVISAAILLKSIALQGFKANFLIKEGLINLQIEIKGEPEKDKYFNPFDLEPEERDDPELLTPEEEVSRELEAEREANEK